MAHKTLTLPEPMGIKVLEIAPTSVYLRWAILSGHGLSTQQLKDLTFEFKTTDNKLNAECIDNKPLDEYKARLCGLSQDTKYRFQIRSKLRLKDKVIFSQWSNRREVSTRAKMDHFIVISNEKELEMESVKHRMRMYMDENKKLKLQIEQLQSQLNEPSVNQPGHWSWDARKIVNWLMRLQDGMFKGYKKKLLKHLKEDGITGKDLNLVNDADLRRWGITDFRARKVALRYIESLTEHDPKPEIQYDPKLSEQLSDPLPESVDAADDDDTAHQEDAVEDKGAATEEKEKENETEKEEAETEDADKKEDDEDADNALITRQKESDFVGISPSVVDLLADHAEADKPKSWRYKEGMLSVNVIRATNCDNKDLDDGADSASDPYVELELKGNYRKERTKSMLNDANPVWKERFQLFVDDARNDVLKARVYDHDKWTRDDKIGEVAIPVITVLGANGYLKKEFDVIGSKSGCKLELEIKYWESKYM